VYRPKNLDAFPGKDTLPVMAWGNGGCAIDGTRYAGFLSTIASHGFVVLATAAVEGEPRRQANAGDLLNALDWADAENLRDGSPLKGKIATRRMAVMGQSCGGFMSIEAGDDPRVGTIGVFNSGVQPPGGNAAPGATITTDALAAIHGPALFVNGGEVDFMMEPSRDNYERVGQVPAFYGSRDNAGH
jgi:dienelactone hydrolase